MADAKKKEKISLEEYLALQQKNKKAAFTIPPLVKMILTAPFIIIFCFGLLFVPFILYSIATSKSAEKKENKAVSYADIKKGAGSAESPSP